MNCKNIKYRKINIFNNIAIATFFCQNFSKWTNTCHIPCQASGNPGLIRFLRWQSEQNFSSCGLTISQRRTLLSPVTY